MKTVPITKVNYKLQVLYINILRYYSTCYTFENLEFNETGVSVASESLSEGKLS
jgi:hypothetical protein